MNLYMNLQLFADAGTLVNTSVNYANAYDASSKTEFSGVNTLSPTLKTFYDTELLENARCKMVFSQFGKKQYLPKGRGKTVEWRKWNTFPRASKLQEGVIPTGQKFGMTYKTASIDQYGAYAAISDRLELRAYDDVILGATEEMGASASETMEYLIRDALLTGTNVLYCDNIKADGTKVGTPTSCATMGAGGTTASGGNTVEDGWALLTPGHGEQGRNQNEEGQGAHAGRQQVCGCDPSQRQLRPAIQQGLGGGAQVRRHHGAVQWRDRRAARLPVH